MSGAHRTPDPHPAQSPVHDPDVIDHLLVQSAFLACPDCGSEDVHLRVWGEGIDSSIECNERGCGAQEVYR
jgi:hypothetical protein